MCVIYKMVKRLPLSGSESIYSPYPWSSAVNSDNCYDYAIGDFERNRNVKSTPGNRAGISSNGLNFTTCKGVKRRILGDNPKTVHVCKNINKACPKGYYKIMSFVSPDGDFHFYKQVRGVKYKLKQGDTLPNIAKFLRVPLSVVRRHVGKFKVGKTVTIPVNLWAHKQGWGYIPIIVDAKGKTIVDPRYASRNYPGLNYTKFCCAYCVKNNKAGSGARSTPGIKTIRSQRKPPNRSRLLSAIFGNLRLRRPRS